jgi:hypothetical protein
MYLESALIGTDVSEELSASFIRVTRIGELGTTLAVTSNRRSGGMSRGRHGETHTAVNLRFIDRRISFLFQVAPHVSSRGSVIPVLDTLLLRKSGSVGNRTQAF